MSAQEVVPKRTEVHQLPDWFMSLLLKFSDSITPMSVFNVAVMAYLQHDSENWIDFVEPIADQSFGTEEDGDALVILALELIEELHSQLDHYLKTVIPVEERVIVDVESKDDYTFTLIWDEGLIQ